MAANRLSLFIGQFIWTNPTEGCMLSPKSKAKMKQIPFLCSMVAMLVFPSLSSALAPDVPDTLAAAREEMTQLQKRYLDKHPTMMAHQARLKALEASAKAPLEEPGELRTAREELAVLRQRCEAQAQKVALLEREMTQKNPGAGASPELQAAMTALSVATERYGVKHPKYQDALQKVKKAGRLPGF